MKRLLIGMVMAIFAVSVYAKDIQELVVTTNPPMSCQNCENKIKGNLRFEKGVKKIETNLSEQRVTIEYDADKTTPEKIEDAFQKIGYKVRVLEEPKTECPAESGDVTQNKPAAACTGGCCKN